VSRGVEQQLERALDTVSEGATALNENFPREQTPVPVRPGSARLLTDDQWRRWTAAWDRAEGIR
jgi:hypothetical protein